MDKLTEFLIKPFLIDVVTPQTHSNLTDSNHLNKESKIKKLVVVFSGRFQPPSLHHKKVYDWIVEKFGKDNVYVASSNIIKSPESPLSFSDKKLIWTQHGVPSDKIVEVKNPYNPEEIKSKFDPNTTALISIFGEKDRDRLSQRTKKNGELSYFLPYSGNENKLVAYPKHGYFVIAPHMSVLISGRELSGTLVRKLLGSKKLSENAKKKSFEKIFGWYDEYIYHLIVPKFETSTNEMVIPVLSESKIQLNEGGNVFDDTTSISKENIDPTLEIFISELSKIFPNKSKSFLSFEKLGSVGKKAESGDIDLAYSSKEFIDEKGNPKLKEWNINESDFKLTYDKIRSRAKTATDDQSRLRSMLDLIGSSITKKSKLEVSLKSTTSMELHIKAPQFGIDKKPLNKNVQIDLNIGDMGWLKFSYYSNTYKDNVKGLHRTQLLLSIFNTKGKMFKHNSGVIDKITRNVEASNPEEAVNLLNKLYGVTFTTDILHDYFKLHDFIKTHLSKEDYNTTIDSYLKILDSTRADIPIDLQKYWIQNQTRLGLTGKFLPDNSSLTPYKK